jgi:hypothetical protein
LRQTGSTAGPVAFPEVAAGDRPLYDLAVVGRSGHDVDPALELGELAEAVQAAHGDHLVVC